MKARIITAGMARRMTREQARATLVESGYMRLALSTLAAAVRLALAEMRR